MTNQEPLTFKGGSFDELFKMANEFPKYETTLYSNTAVGGNYIEEELCLSNLVRAVVFLYEGGSVTFKDLVPEKEFYDD